ncbi:MarC family protein, partial [bacterium M00.F.Ca.ET.163.01.1.1]
MVESLIADILFGFTGLISIINPIGVAFVFLDRTASLTTDERTALARKIA